MQVLTDGELAKTAATGDKLAFKTLVERHQPFVVRVAFRFLLDREEAKDVTQEAFIRLWKHLTQYRQEVKLTTWLYRITINLCIDAVSSRHGKRKKMMTEVSELIPSSADLPSQRMEANEQQQWVVRLAESLTPKQKAVFVLRDLEDLSVQETELALSMSSSQVKSNLFQARKKIREMMVALNRLPKK